MDSIRLIFSLYVFLSELFFCLCGTEEIGGKFCAAHVVKNLLLFGDPGLGKTFLSACVARVVSEDGFSVVYDTAGHVFARCEAAKFHADEEPDAAMDVRRFESCDLLILDDLGTEMATSFVQSALYQLVNGRLITGKSTIISTNLTPVQISSRYGAAIWSRLQGEYTVLPFYGEDIRKLKRAMR